MNEISLLTSQFSTRLVSVILFISFTWFLAKFAQFIFGRLSHQGSPRPEKTHTSINRKKIASSISFWAVFLIISPFILGAAGLDALWLTKVQTFIGGFFSNWLALILLALLFAVGIKLLPNLPKISVHFKRTPDTSPKEL